MITKISNRTLLAVLLNFVLLVSCIHAQTITGKVVGVADGDTITVLEGTTQHKIRFYGADCPESGQDFGRKAKQFVSGMVFGKQVQVVPMDMISYDRVVGIVYVGNTCVNQEVVKAGLAWIDHRYCKDNICREWTDIEAQAKAAKMGLWSHPDPIPPWDYRRGDRGGTKAVLGGNYHGNTSSHVFHKKGCKHFNCKNCTKVFPSREAAIREGFRPCGGCKP